MVDYIKLHIIYITNFKKYKKYYDNLVILMYFLISIYHKFLYSIIYVSYKIFNFKDI